MSKSDEMEIDCQMLLRQISQTQNRDENYIIEKWFLNKLIV